MMDYERYNYWEKVYKRFERDHSWGGYISRLHAKMRMEEAMFGLPKRKFVAPPYPKYGFVSPLMYIKGDENRQA